MWPTIAGSQLTATLWNDGVNCGLILEQLVDAHDACGDAIGSSPTQAFSARVGRFRLDVAGHHDQVVAAQSDQVVAAQGGK